MKGRNPRVACSAIALPNPANIRLHERLGFTKVTHLAGVEFKFRAWIDVGYWEFPLHRYQSVSSRANRTP